MSTVLVIHHYNGATKVCTLRAPVVSKQMIDGGIHVVLYGVQGGEPVGDAMFTEGSIVGLSGVAIEQYGPIQPTQKPITEENAA